MADEHESKTIDDLIILGQAAPVEISKGRKSICTAGWSPKEGLVRLYPVPPSTRARTWTKVKVPVVRNKQDVRYESWKIEGSDNEWDRLHLKIEQKDALTEKSEKTKLLSDLLENYEYDCVLDLNSERGSLGFIRPKNLEPYFKDRGKFESTIQTTLDSPILFKTAGNYKKIPMMKYKCSNCKAKNGHNQQILDWGLMNG